MVGSILWQVRCNGGGAFRSLIQVTQCNGAFQNAIMPWISTPYYLISVAVQKSCNPAWFGRRQGKPNGMLANYRNLYVTAFCWLLTQWCPNDVFHMVS